MSQADAIMEALLNGETLTPLSALIKVHTMRLAARIMDLEKQGVPIIHEWKRVGKKKVMSYRLGKVAHG